MRSHETTTLNVLERGMHAWNKAIATSQFVAAKRYMDPSLHCSTISAVSAIYASELS